MQKAQSGPAVPPRRRGLLSDVGAVPLANAAAGPRPDSFDNRRLLMAKSQKRNNREQKKPKQDKTKEALPQSALTALHERPTLPTPAKKK